MNRDKGRSADGDRKKTRAVPTGLGRLGRVARLAGGVAGGMLAEGSRQLREGKRPRARDLLLTPGNARRVAEQLADMRGAAMKLGQMLSMDTGELLPRELADILARLRADASTMPPAQLHRVMRAAYGEDWEAQLYGFEQRPLAAASIGQVHRCYSPEGDDMVLKVQYPGVSRSIDSDVDNIATLLRLSGLLPGEIDLTPLLDDAKRQLQDEADYLREAEFLRLFGDKLADDERFVVPQVYSELCRPNVLAMSYEEGEPIETLRLQPRDERDRVMSALIELLLLELFELRMVQTDPNFANYRYREHSGEIVLLDFGATRRFKAAFVNGYRRLAAAAQAGDMRRMAAAADKLGYEVGDDNSHYRDLVMELFTIALEPLRHEGPYDFGRSDMPARMSALAEKLTEYREFWRAPPSDAIYFHRKLGGMFMLAGRLGASVDVKAIMARHLPRPRKR